MKSRELGTSGLKIAPLVLGGNVFGWTADRKTSFDILDAFLEAGFNAIDTADAYSAWVPGHKGGESETVIGDWMADRGVRDRVVLITKGGWAQGLSASAVAQACEASLKRLRTDRIDLYFAHKPDPATPIAETLEAHGKLLESGKIRCSGASNYDAAMMKDALAASGGGRARFGVIQPHYNLHTRHEYEGDLENLCVREKLGVIPYFGLGAGFLTGKYKTAADAEGSQRGGRVKGYFDARGVRILGALEQVAARHGATMAQVALAWIMARPSVTAPIASATSVAQLKDIMASASLALTAQDMAELDIKA